MMDTFDSKYSVPIGADVGVGRSAARWRQWAIGCTSLCVVVLCCCAFGSYARAQPRSQPVSVLLLSPGGAGAKAQRADIVRGLRDAGVRAVQVADLPVDPVFAACRQPACAVQVAHLAGMPAVLCAVDLGVLQVRWIGPEDGFWTQRAAIGVDGLSGTTSELARRLLLQRALGARALLRVHSRPEGASVTVDGKLAGLTPLEQTWEPGAHVVGVVLEGYQPERADAQLSSGDVRDVRFELHATGNRVFGQRVDSSRAAASSANFVLGSVLGVAALPLLIAGANGFIDRGQCLQSEAAVCTQRAHAGAAEATMLGVGSAALLGALYFFVARPLRFQIEASPHAASVRMQGRF